MPNQKFDRSANKSQPSSSVSPKGGSNSYSYQYSMKLSRDAGASTEKSSPSNWSSSSSSISTSINNKGGRFRGYSTAETLEELKAQQDNESYPSPRSSNNSVLSDSISVDISSSTSSLSSHDTIDANNYHIRGVQYNSDSALRSAPRPSRKKFFPVGDQGNITEYVEAPDTTTDNHNHNHRNSLGTAKNGRYPLYSFIQDGLSPKGRDTNNNAHEQQQQQQPDHQYSTTTAKTDSFESAMCAVMPKLASSSQVAMRIKKMNNHNNDDSVITTRNLVTILNDCSKDLSENDLQAVVRASDPMNTGIVHYEDFIGKMRDLERRHNAAKPRSASAPSSPTTSEPLQSTTTTTTTPFGRSLAKSTSTSALLPTNKRNQYTGRKVINAAEFPWSPKFITIRTLEAREKVVNIFS